MWFVLAFKEITLRLREEKQILEIHCEPVSHAGGNAVRFVPDDRVAKYPSLFVYHADCEAVGLEEEAFFWIDEFTFRSILLSAVAVLIAEASEYAVLSFKVVRLVTRWS